MYMHMGNQKTIDFIQLRREVEMPGTFAPGEYDFPFSFKNVDLDIESHCGIDLVVEYCCTAEMIYFGNLKKYTCAAKEIFSVASYSKQPQNEGASVRLTMAAEGLDLQLLINSNNLNMETDWICGWVRAKESAEIEQLESVRL